MRLDFTPLPQVQLLSHMTVSLTTVVTVIVNAAVRDFPPIA